MAIRVKLPTGEIGEFPDDMSHEEIEAVLQKQFPPANQPEPQAEEQPERTGLFGVASDLAHGLGNASKFALDIPNKLEKSGKYIEENPGGSILHNVGQLAAESADIGKGIINAPYNLSQYLARKHLLPQVLGKLGKLIPHLPKDMGIEKGLGLEADKAKGDELIRAIPDIASLAFGGRGLAKQAKKAFAAPDLKQALRDTQKVVNESTAEAGKVFDKVESEVDKRGLNIPIDDDLLDKAKHFLAKTPENAELIASAKKGDFKAIRAIQSDLRVKAEKALASKLRVDTLKGEEMSSVRDRINKGVERHLEDTGHEDLAEDLSKTRKDYRDIKTTYFSTPALAKVFGKSQRIPKNPMTLLTEESTEMNKFMSAHPGLEKALKKALKHDTRMRLLGKVGAGLGIGTAAEGARELFGRK